MYNSHGGEYENVAPCSLVEVDRRIKGAHCLHNQGPSPWWWRQYEPPKRRSTSVSLQDAIFQKAVIFKDSTFKYDTTDSSQILNRWPRISFPTSFVA
jgi:hypothetical protein